MYLYGLFKRRSSFIPSASMRMMSLLACFFFTLIYRSYAENSYSQDAEFHLLLKNMTLEQALDRIEAETGYTFLYTDQTLERNRRVDIDIQTEDIREVLHALFHTMDVRYRIVDRQIVLARQSAQSAPGVQQTRRVTGLVTDVNKEPVIGANVMLKGTLTGVITDTEGRFALDVLENAVLQISYIGYISREIPLRGESSLRIELQEDLKAIDEVVVIGYGSIRKSDLTGSVASVKTAEIQQTPMVSIDQGLVGRASGVQVIQTSGMPGATASIRVRGSSSLQGGNEPLYVIDGFPVYSGEGFGNTGGKTSLSGLSTVNPSDIESIEILKDAAATAIYGARAANGVVLITTKSGKKGHDVITFESNFGMSNVSKKIAVMDAQEYALLVNEAYTNDGLTPYYSSEALADI
ncbi:MAG: TonB-dependent receptor plug domain-containing protein, partial [Tannerellaceae bacterium]|nr:TonB-dependent receptor plug domain-containing protein [Tannerellaceae bacterium]